MKWTKLALSAMTLATFGMCFMACDDPPSSPEEAAEEEDVMERSLDGNTAMELDGDAVSDAAQGVDWDQALDPNNATFVARSFTADPAPLTIFTGGGSKDPELVSKWKHKDGSVPDKDDITNAYATSFFSAQGDFIIYFGADRFNNNGDAFIGFWFFQEEITPDPDGTFTGEHQVGDILVLANFSKGGSVPQIQVLRWIGNAPGGPLQMVFNGNALCTSGIVTDACAITNSMQADSPWEYIGKGTDADGPFPPETFFEGGINVTDLIPGQAPCFASFMAETRSSTSVTATLKDFTLKSFQVCEPEMVLNTMCNGASLDTSSGLRIAVDWSVQVCNESTGVDLENVIVSLPDGSTGTVSVLPDTGTVAERCRTFSSIDAGRDPYFPDSADGGETDPCDAKFTFEASATAEADIGGPEPEEVTADDSDFCKLCPCTL